MNLYQWTMYNGQWTILINGQSLSMNNGQCTMYNLYQWTFSMNNVQCTMDNYCRPDYVNEPFLWTMYNVQ